MKKLLSLHCYLFILLLFLQCTAYSQATIVTRAKNYYGPTGNIHIPVTVENFSNVCSMSLALKYSASILHYDSISLNPAMADGLTQINVISLPIPTILLSWFSITPMSLNYYDTLFMIHFTASGGLAYMNWRLTPDGSCQYSNCEGTVLPSEFLNGVANCISPPECVLNPTPADGNFIDGNTIHWQQAGGSPPSVYKVFFGTENPPTSPPANAIYTSYEVGPLLPNTVYYWKIVPKNLGGEAANCPVWSFLSGTPISTTVASYEGPAGNIQIPVTVENFTNIYSLSLTLNFNNTLLTFNSIEPNPALAGSPINFSLVNSPSPGVQINWNSLSPVTLPAEATLFTINFTAAAGTSNLSWDTDGSDHSYYTVNNQVEFPSNFTGSVVNCVPPPPCAINPAPAAGASSAATLLSWQSGGGSPTSYKVYLGTSNPPVNLVQTTSSTSFSPQNLIPNNHYYWKVVPANIGGEASDCPVWDFDVLPTIVTTAHAVIANPGSIQVPVTVRNFTNVGSFNLTLQYDPSFLTFTGYIGNPAIVNGNGYVFFINSPVPAIQTTWFSLFPITLPQDALIGTLLFNASPGSCDLNWDSITPTFSEYKTISGSIFPSSYENGSVICQLPTACATNPTPIIGGQTHINHLLSWQDGGDSPNSYKVYFGTDNPPATLVQNGPTTTYTAADLLNNQQYYWKVVPSKNGIDATNCPVWNFKAYNDLIATIGSFNGPPGEIEIPVTVRNFNEIVHFELALGFKKNLLSFSNIVFNNAIPLTPLDWSLAAAGPDDIHLNMIYHNLNYPISLPQDAILFTISFTANPGSSNIQWEFLTEFYNQSYTGLYFNLIDGTVNCTAGIPPPGCPHNPVPANLECSNTTSLSWHNGGGNPTGYKVYHALNYPILRPQIVSSANFVIPQQTPNTHHVWQVVPVNQGGFATGCPVWEFFIPPAFNSCPQVSNVTISEYPDCDYLVHITYNVYDQEGTPMNIKMKVSADNGNTWNYPVNPSFLTGDIGQNVSPGNNKHIIWNFGADHPDLLLDQVVVKIIADDGGTVNNTGPCPDDCVYTEDGQNYHAGTANAPSAVIYSIPTISGKITSINGNTPIQYAQVVLTTSSGQIYTTYTNVAGNYYFNNIPPQSLDITVSRIGFQSTFKYISLSNSCNTHNFILFPLYIHFIYLTENLRIWAENITEGPNGYYTLTGDVIINNIMFLESPVYIDIRNINTLPVLSGAGNITLKNIEGNNYYLYQGSQSFKFSGLDNRLIPYNLSSCLPTPITYYQFPLKLIGISVDENGVEANANLMPVFPYPLGNVLNEALHRINLTDPDEVDSISFTKTFSVPNGIEWSGNIQGLSMNFKGFKISNFNLGIDPDDPKFIADFQFTYPASRFLSLKVGVTFVPGAIYRYNLLHDGNQLIGETGLSITDISGRITNLINKNDWRITANTDIQNGLELPGLGSPLNLDNVAVQMRGPDYFRAVGPFSFFGSSTSNSFLEYNSKKKALSGEANLNIANMLTGKSSLNLRYISLSGSGRLNSRTPLALPLSLRWLQNKNMPLADASISNYNIWTQCNYMGVPITQRYEFGKQDYPFFHYYIGSNYRNMVKIWKGKKSDKSSIQFQVPENCPQLYISASDTAGLSIIDFQLMNPAGNTYDSTWGSYYRFPDVHQTLLVIDHPISGDWTFLTNDTANLVMEPLFLDQPPSGMITQPSKNASNSGVINMDFTDYADTLQVRIFYDTDRTGFDGSLIQEFQVINNAHLSFTWQQQDIPEGEYFIYFEASDGKNSPVLQYAQGSIVIEDSLITEIPANLNAIQNIDSVQVIWDAAVNPALSTTYLYLTGLSDGRQEVLSITDTNIIYLTNLIAGHSYEIYCRFTDSTGHKGPACEKLAFSFLNPDGINNPPAFIKSAVTTWNFITNELSSYTLDAMDADQDLLSFSLPFDTLGITVNGSQLQWNPATDQFGSYTLIVVVSDGTSTDTATIQVNVYTTEQSAVAVSFSSSNLYEGDRKFIHIRDFNSTANSCWVTLTNLKTGNLIETECQRISDFGFIGQFNLSSQQKSSLPVSNGDTISATYIANGQTYITLAKYDSLPQPSDLIIPGPIDDLSFESFVPDKIQLKWTATGNDGNAGKAFRYDIRYAYAPILSDDDYLVANRIPSYPYPSIAGNTDSLVILLDSLQEIALYDSIWFSIKAEDENQNRSNLGNSPLVAYHLAPSFLTAAVLPGYQVNLNWPNIHPIGFEHFSLFRKIDSEPFELLCDTLSMSVYTDDLFLAPDGNYQYAVQIAYSNSQSTTVNSNPVSLNRFTDLIVLCQLENTLIYDSISFSMTALDTVYSMSFNRVTDPFGLILLPAVFHGDYYIQISKPGFLPYTDTITVSETNNVLLFNLLNLIQPVSFGGNIQYDNDNSSPLGNVLVYLKNPNNEIIDSTLTTTNGNFYFEALPGNYTFRVACNKPHGGMNAVDALQILKYFTGMDSLSTIRREAADVNSSASINSIDALLIAKRFVALISSFAAGDWYFEIPVVQITNGPNESFTIKGLCYGDVNGSYNP
jgi:hypothetical protein